MTQGSELVPFIRVTAGSPGTADLHGGSSGGLIEVAVKDIASNWQLVVDNAATLVSEALKSAAAHGIALDQVKIGLAFDAKGKLAFVAELNAHGSVELLFKRSADASDPVSPSAAP